MYYSKNSPTRHGERIVVPENYSGNAFRVKDETDRHTPQAEATYKKEEQLSSEALVADRAEPAQDIATPPQAEPESQAMAHAEEKSEKKPSLLSSLLPPKTNGGLLSSIFHDIDIEDILVFALLLMLYQDDSDDDVLILLLILLFLK